MIWNRNLDEKIKEAGWVLDTKDDRGVVYKKEINTRIFIKYKTIEILHNQFTIYSSIPGMMSTEPARLTYEELKLFTKKFKQIKKEYGWK